MRKFVIAIAFLFTAGFIGVGGFIFVYSDFLDGSGAPTKKQEELITRLLNSRRRYLNRETVDEMKQGGVRFVTIPKGFTFKKAVDLLEREGVISSALLFRAYAWLEGGKKKKRGLRAGRFGFHAAMKPAQVFSALFGDPVIYVERVTIPEGFHLREIAARLDAKGICKKEEFIKAAFDKDLLKRWGIPGDRAEGYLFPDTYEFRINESATKVISRMISKFRREWLPKWEQRARELGMGRHQAVTLASIIEKETGQPNERPLISSVFHNRMKLAMKLQTDPTTCYAIMEVEGWPEGKKCDITRSNKLIRNPYNTYWKRGFPPGPIASPGRASLRAAVYPERSKYLFFVSKNDGSHLFSTKYQTHKQLVQKWQQNFFRKRGRKVTADAAHPGDDPTARTRRQVRRRRVRTARPRRRIARRRGERSSQRRARRQDDDDDEF